MIETDISIDKPKVSHAGLAGTGLISFRHPEQGEGYYIRLHGHGTPGMVIRIGRDANGGIAGAVVDEDGTWEATSVPQKEGEYHWLACQATRDATRVGPTVKVTGFKVPKV